MGECDLPCIFLAFILFYLLPLQRELSSNLWDKVIAQNEHLSWYLSSNPFVLYLRLDIAENVSGYASFQHLVAYLHLPILMHLFSIQSASLLAFTICLSVIFSSFAHASFQHIFSCIFSAYFNDRTHASFQHIIEPDLCIFSAYIFLHLFSIF